MREEEFEIALKVLFLLFRILIFFSKKYTIYLWRKFTPLYEIKLVKAMRLFRTYQNLGSFNLYKI